MISWVFGVSRWSAYLGGLILCTITLMSMVSIAGRSLTGIGFGPVPGDYEMVEVGMALAVFLFLPWCYLRNAHATVDLIYTHLPIRLRRLLNVLSDIVMLLLWLALTWMLFEGMLEKRSNQESTFILQIPVWWAYTICLMGALIGCSAYIAHTLIQLGVASYPENWVTQSSGAN